MGLFDGTTFERPLRCDGCGRPQADCQCTDEDRLRLLSKVCIVRLNVERRGGNRMVTHLRGMEGEGELETAARVALLGKIKSECGTGGTEKEGVLEIQGDQRARLRLLLTTLGFRVR